VDDKQPARIKTVLSQVNNNRGTNMNMKLVVNKGRETGYVSVFLNYMINP